MSAIFSAREFRPAAIHFAVTFGLGIIFAITAGSVDGDGLTKTFILVSLIAVLLGTVGAMVRTYLSWRSGGRWQIWQGATWLMLGLSLLWFTSTLPSIIL